MNTCFPQSTENSHYYPMPYAVREMVFCWPYTGGEVAGALVFTCNWWILLALGSAFKMCPGSHHFSLHCFNLGSPMSHHHLPPEHQWDFLNWPPWFCPGNPIVCSQHGGLSDSVKIQVNSCHLLKTIQRPSHLTLFIGGGGGSPLLNCLLIKIFIAI